LGFISDLALLFLKASDNIDVLTLCVPMPIFWLLHAIDTENIGCTVDWRVLFYLKLRYL
jgi:hypothetical protein